MTNASRALVSTILAMLVALLLQACSGEADYGSRKAGRFPRLIMDSLVAIPSCGGAVAPGVSTRNCRFVEANTGQSITSIFSHSGLRPLEDLQSFPVIIIEVPAAAGAFAATYDNLRGTRGFLNITAGFTTLPAHGATNIVAEPGMQLAVIELPPAAPADTYFMVLSFESPTTEIKAMTTGKLIAAGRPFYPPLVPCTNDFSAIRRSRSSTRRSRPASTCAASPPRFKAASARRMRTRRSRRVRR